MDILGAKFEKRNTYFNNQMMVDVDLAMVNEHKYSARKLDTPPVWIRVIGGIMEKDVAMLKKINEEAEESKNILRQTFNDVKATSDLLQPALKEMVLKIRDSRMTVSIELRQALTVMKDVRNFFLEESYIEEIDRLERFVRIGERLKKLINDGTMDAVCDVILRLAIGKEGEDA